MTANHCLFQWLAVLLKTAPGALLDHACNSMHPFFSVLFSQGPLPNPVMSCGRLAGRGYLADPGCGSLAGRGYLGDGPAHWATQGIRLGCFLHRGVLNLNPSTPKITKIQHGKTIPVSPKDDIRPVGFTPVPCKRQ